MCRWLVLFCMVIAATLTPRILHAQSRPQASASETNAQGKGAVYTLPPEKMKLSEELFRTSTRLHFLGAGWDIAQLLLLLMLGIPPRLRDAALRITHRRWIQGLLFTFFLLFVLLLLDLPLAMYGHSLGLSYGLSVQGWKSWFGDMAKGFLLNAVVTGLATLLLFWLIRRSPRRWWLWFWVPAMLASIFGVFISPLLIDPLFNHFTPLAEHDPALVRRLEQVVSRGDLKIPPDRMFLMDASSKYTGLNAYVTGIGPSKRVVVWDTSLAKGTPDEICFIFGHEMGHYVLHHIYKTLLFVGVLMFAAFGFGYCIIQWILRRYGARWRIHSQNDWAAMAIYLMVLSMLTFATEPIINGYSRANEHAADVYGQEAIHGIVADPQATAVAAFQILGESGLDDPRPHPFVEWWSFSHPSIQNRATFAANYNPWVAGQHPQYFRH